MPAAAVTPALLVIVGLSAFFTLADLFGPHAIAPVLAHAFATSTPRIGVAINAAIAGMMTAGLLSSLFADRIGRKPAMVGALALLAVPTALLAFCADLTVFEVLRIAQGFLMCVSFAVTIAYVAEEWGPSGAAPALMGAYLTGNVAANLFGRMIAGAVADFTDWRNAFVVFAAINLVGAGLLYLTLPASRRQPLKVDEPISIGLRNHLRNRALCGAFGVGFLILFTFVGIFTYVNFRLSQPPFGLSSGAIGLAYLVFAPAMLITLLVGRTVQRFGYRTAFLLGSSVALVGCCLTLAGHLSLLLLGLAVIGSGLFFSQAVATGFTGHAAVGAKGAASGLYLAAYYAGGLCGAWVMGILFDSYAWVGCALAGVCACSAMMIIVGLTWRASSGVVLGAVALPEPAE